LARRTQKPAQLAKLSPVDDQSKALAFYTEVLGFRKHSDIPMGEYRWLTVVSPDGVDGAEFKRLAGRGVKFRGEPKQMGPVKAVSFEDNCGNLINLVQPQA
jgi:catechol 2,3-dioxygenase-like lactoylglutathione lyase family enzyme